MDVPPVTAVTSPVVLTVATVGVLEVHVTLGELVRLLVTPVVPETPSKIIWLVCPEAVSDTDDGEIVKDVYCSAAPADTVRVATPVTTVPVVASLYSAVIVVVPAPTAVAKPVVAPIVATVRVLELQVTALVRYSVAPVDVVPIAMN